LSRSLVLVLILGLLSPCVTSAQEDVQETLQANLDQQRYSVRIDGVQVSDAASVYLAADDTLYVPGADLDAWHLKRPPSGTIVDENGVSLYGLQSDLKLAATVDHSIEELEIIAPRGAFVGVRAVQMPSLTPGSGAFLNYELRREQGQYALSFGSPAGVFENRYISTYGKNNMEFHRASTRWYWLDPSQHYVLQLGDARTDGGLLGESVSFAGAHLASDFKSDPTYVSYGHPAVSGVALAPSLLEVYVNNLLEYRANIPEGPFTVDDLPPEAADSDVVMVLTDAKGVKTTLSGRGAYSPDNLAKGLTAYSFDAGLARHNENMLGSFYNNGVVSSTLRHGFTNQITGELYFESIEGKRFGDMGADLELSKRQTVVFRYGSGQNRRAVTFEYASRRGNS